MKFIKKLFYSYLVVVASFMTFQNLKADAVYNFIANEGFHPQVTELGKEIARTPMEYTVQNNANEEMIVWGVPIIGKPTLLAVIPVGVKAKIEVPSILESIQIIKASIGEEVAAAAQEGRRAFEEYLRKAPDTPTGKPRAVVYYAKSSWGQKEPSIVDLLREINDCVYANYPSLHIS